MVYEVDRSRKKFQRMAQYVGASQLPRFGFLEEVSEDESKQWSCDRYMTGIILYGRQHPHFL